MIAINQCETRAAGQNTYAAVAQACQTFLGFRPHLAGTIMRDEAVSEAIRSQRTLISTNPSSQPIQDVIAIAHTLLGRTAKELHY